MMGQRHTLLALRPHQVEAIGQSELDSVALEPVADSSECSECQTELLTVYDWDSPQFLCENCGLYVAGTAIRGSD